MSGKRIVNDPKAREKPCLRCGYSLRKLEDSRYCPECGLSVWLSLNQNDSLEFSKPAWVNQQRIGMVILAGAQAFGLVVAMSAVLLWAVTSLRARATEGWIAALSLALAVHYFGYAAGLFMLSRDEDRHPDRLKGQRWALLIAGALMAAVGLLIAMMRGGGRATGYGGLAAMMMIVAFPTLIYAGRLASRLVSARARRACLWLMVGPGCWILAALGNSSMVGRLRMIDGIAIAYLAASLALFAWFAVKLRKAMADAARTWDAETAPGAGR